jgi:hypothetical protein
MKKLITLLLFVFISGCEVNPESQSVVVEPKAVVEESHSEQQIEIEVLEELDEETDDVIEKDATEESQVEEPTSYVFLDQYSMKELLLERLYEASDDRYHDFRYLGRSNYSIYFTNGHSVQILMSNYVPDRVIHILEMMEMVGQALSRLPDMWLLEIDSVQIADNTNEPTLNNGVLLVGRKYLEEHLFTNQFYKHFMFPVILNWINTSTKELSTEAFQDLDNTVSIQASESQRLNLEETYALQLLLQLELASELERNQVEALFASRLEYLEELVPSTEPVNHPWLTHSKLMELNLPNHQNPNINGAFFYDIITPETPSSLVEITFHGSGIRYYEKLTLPQGCFHPFDCPTQQQWTLDHQYTVYLFQAEFANGQVIEFNVESSASIERATEISQALAFVYGQMPDIMLLGIQGVLIVDGRGGVWGGPYHGWFTTLSNCGECDLFNFTGLEELVLHELVHSTLDEGTLRPDHENPSRRVSSLGLVRYSDWATQIKLDNTFPSQYAEDYPKEEDLAETILLYAAMRYYPDRLHPITPDAIRRFMPNRVALLDELFDRIEGEESQ